MYIYQHMYTVMKLCIKVINCCYTIWFMYYKICKENSLTNTYSLNKFHALYLHCLGKLIELFFCCCSEFVHHVFSTTKLGEFVDST